MMETVHLSRTCRRLACGFTAVAVMALLGFGAMASLPAAPAVVLGAPFRPLPYLVQASVTNCLDPNFDYVVQTSPDLQAWSDVSTNRAMRGGRTLLATAPASDGAGFLRVKVVPHALTPLFSRAIVTVSNLNLNGYNCLVNSFDSSDTNCGSQASYSVLGTNNNVLVYDPSKAKSGGDVGVGSAVLGNASLGNCDINGHLHTGLGDPQSNVQIGPNGGVGETSWTASNSGIEGSGTASSWWSPDFNVDFPDVSPPTGLGAPLLLPAAVNTNGGIYIVLNLNGGYFATTSSSAANNLLILAPTTLWIQGSAAVGVTMANTNATLTLYVGRTNTTGDTFSFSGNGTMNQPGYAKNFKIYGLRSLTRLALSGNAGWTGLIYAPYADMDTGGGGNNTQDVIGAIVVKSITSKGRWNFHYDESLKANGPVY